MNENARPPKLDPRLALLLEDQPDEIHPVVVRFRRAPSREELRALGLGGGDSPIATGRLDRQGILRLTEQEDVLLVEPMPEVYPSA